MMATGRTEAGIILGTAAYMSPEQARGRPVDKRADIWAFGCVLYEMLTGRQAFSGESTTDVLASVVQREPDWSLLPANLPAGVHALLRRALQKNARERLRDIGDARIELAATATTDSGISTRAARARASRRRRPAAIADGGHCAGVPRNGSAWRRRGVAVAPRDRAGYRGAGGCRPQFDHAPAVDVVVAGTRIVGRVVAGRPSARLRRQRRRDDSVVSAAARSLRVDPAAGTEGAANPFFSLDGRWIGFFADSKLKKVSLDGGAPVALADAAHPTRRGLAGRWVDSRHADE